MLKTLKNQNGFTLIELVIVIVIVSIMAGVLANVLSQGTESWLTVAPRKDAVQHTRYAMDRMVREIRELDSGSITAATATQITFTRDSGATNVNFNLNGTGLEYNSSVLTDDVQAFSFTYYDINNAVIAVPVSPFSNVWLIFIDLTVQKENETVRLVSSVHPRNLSTNNTWDEQ